MIASFDSPDARDAARAGNKAATLARLRRAGFAVPDGFVVMSRDAAASAAFLDHLGALGADTPVAVRSSGHAEDSPGASFAGQYESILNVRGADAVRAAIDRCFTSFTSERASAYAQGLPGAATNGGGSVIVQRLVPARAAGVAFTVDPVSGDRGRVVIDAATGLGDAVASGRTAPDGFAVDKASGAIVDRRLAREHASVDDAAVRSIAALAMRVEAYEGAPVDIEWAFHDGQVFLLQSRPITASRVTAWQPGLTTAIDPRFPLYSNGNVSEILPGCVTPLTYSLFSRGVERAFRDVAESIGSMQDVGPQPIVVGFFFHRVYLNVSYFMTAADNSPGATRDTVYEDLIGPPPSRHPAWTAADFLPWNLWKGLRIIGRYLAMQGRLDKDITACEAQFHETRARFQSRSWTAAELADWLMVDDTGLRPAIVHIRASQAATSSFASLRNLTRRWLGDESGALASSLVTGIGDLATARPAAALYDLAQVLGSASESSPEFTAALDAFVAAYGHRGFREAELRSPTWREQPSLVIGHVRRQLEPGTVPPAAIAERQKRVAADALAQASARLPKWKRNLFESAVRNARKYIAAREQMKDLLLRYLDLTRHVVAAAKERLAPVLRDGDDIYFLLDREVARALRGELAAADGRAIVARRRRDFARCMRLEVPKVQDGVARVLTPQPLPAATTLQGVAISPGHAQGRARVILNPEEASIEEGEILVAPATDIAWTPLFLRAAGLVVEVGGPLSHGSIVAREYGIPAVTGVASATRRILTGDLLHVNGDQGVVVIARNT